MHEVEKKGDVGLRYQGTWCHDKYRGTATLHHDPTPDQLGAIDR